MENLKIRENFINNKKMVLVVVKVLLSGTLLLSGCSTNNSFKTEIICNGDTYSIADLYIVTNNETKKEFACYKKQVVVDTDLSIGIVISQFGDGPLSYGTNGFGYGVGGLSFSNKKTYYYGFYDIYDEQLITVTKSKASTSVDCNYTIESYYDWTSLDLYEESIQNKISEEINNVLEKPIVKGLNP